MKVILIPDHSGGDRTLTIFDTQALELSEELEDTDQIGFIPKPIINTILTVEVKSVTEIIFIRKRNIMKHIQKLFRSGKNGKSNIR